MHFSATFVSYFPGESGFANFPFVFFQHCVLERTFGDELYQFLQIIYHACHLTISVKAVKDTQSIDPSWRPGPILFYPPVDLWLKGHC